MEGEMKCPKCGRETLHLAGTRRKCSAAPNQCQWTGCGPVVPPVTLRAAAWLQEGFSADVPRMVVGIENPPHPADRDSATDRERRRVERDTCRKLSEEVRRQTRDFAKPGEEKCGACNGGPECALLSGHPGDHDSYWHQWPQSPPQPEPTDAEVLEEAKRRVLLQAHEWHGDTAYGCDCSPWLDDAMGCVCWVTWPANRPGGINEVTHTVNLADVRADMMRGRR